MREFKDLEFEPHRMSIESMPVEVANAMRGTEMEMVGWQYKDDKISVICGGYLNDPVIGGPFYCVPRKPLNDPMDYEQYEVWVTGEDDVRTASKEEIMNVINN